MISHPTTKVVPTEEKNSNDGHTDGDGDNVATRKPHITVEVDKTPN